VELEKYFVSLWGESRFFLNFHIWTTEVIPYNGLNSEFANFETPCIIFSYKETLTVYATSYTIMNIEYNQKDQIN
jgi:hypothetical protein